MKRLAALAFATLFAVFAKAQIPAAELANPPADARHFIILSTGGKHGDSWEWTLRDGTRMSRESLNLRGQVSEIDTAISPGADGMPAKVVVRGVTPQGDAAETFTIAGGQATWQSPVDKGAAAYTAPRYYASFGGTMDTAADFIERLINAPGRTLELLPGGKAHAEKLTTLEVGDAANRQTISCWSVTGISNSPTPLWTDAKGRFFGINFGLAWLPAGYEDLLKRTEKAQDDAFAAEVARISHSLPSQGPGRLHRCPPLRRRRDSIPRRQTVVVDDGRIVAVGPAASTTVLAGAERIDGRGKTLVPGLWDAHMHVGDDYTGIQELSMGVTSVRDPGNSDALTQSTRRAPREGRAAVSQCLSVLADRR